MDFQASNSLTLARFTEQPGEALFDLTGKRAKNFFNLT
jgi:hypothetical protein